MPERKLKEVKGIGDQKAKRIAAAAAYLVPTRLVNATEMLATRKSVIRLRTGSEQLDSILQGGVETGQITEVFGEFRSGKTQLCHALCVSCQLPVDLGGASSKALYIDTESTFRPDRLVDIAKRYGLSSEDVLENVTYARSFNAEHQEELLAEAAALFSDTRYALLVVDSATGLFRTDYSGRSELAERQQALNRFLRKLQCITDTHGVAVVITNQVMASPDSGLAVFTGPQVKPVGGHVIAHASQTRLFLRKGKGESRICKVHDSPVLPVAEATFEISKGGIVDADQEPQRRSRAKVGVAENALDTPQMGLTRSKDVGQSDKAMTGDRRLSGSQHAGGSPKTQPGRSNVGLSATWPWVESNKGLPARWP